MPGWGLSRIVRFRLALTVLLALSPLVPSSVTVSAAVPQQVSHETRACPGGYVALTFDDGPSESTTLRIVSELRAGEARGVFFMIGTLAGAHPDIVRRVRVAGMDVGNHTYDHPFLDQLDPTAVKMEITSTNDMLAGLAGPAPTLFRPPYGRTNATVSAAARDLGMTEVLWTYDSDDYENVSVAKMLEVAAKAKDGDILLFHDGYENTVAAIPLILADFSKRGICSGKVVPSTIRKQAWVDYAGDDRTYYYATTARW